MENILVVPQKATHKLPRGPAIPQLGIYPKELKAETWTNIYTSIFIAAFFPRAPKVQTTQVSIDRQMDKQNVAYTQQKNIIRPQKGRKFSHSLQYG